MNNLWLCELTQTRFNYTTMWKTTIAGVNDCGEIKIELSAKERKVAIILDEKRLGLMGCLWGSFASWEIVLSAEQCCQMLGQKVTKLHEP